jgi:hypothetical protein
MTQAEHNYFQIIPASEVSEKFYSMFKDLSLGLSVAASMSSQFSEAPLGGMTDFIIISSI